ncbi:MAG TPA: hypothetical protein VD994_09580 [Prosthecobacter sp.]|nr:hypothetical protein [Prosthecobacter sp.]
MKLKLNKETVLGGVRHALTFLGGFLVARGVADQGQVAEVTAAIVTIAGFAWSAIDKQPKTTQPE